MGKKKSKKRKSKKAKEPPKNSKPLPSAQRQLLRAKIDREIKNFSAKAEKLYEISSPIQTPTWESMFSLDFPLASSKKKKKKKKKKKENDQQSAHQQSKEKKKSNPPQSSFPQKLQTAPKAPKVSSEESLRHWFHTRQFRLSEIKSTPPQTLILQLSLDIGKHYLHYRFLLGSIKQCIAQKVSHVTFHFTPSQYTQPEESFELIDQFCATLNALQFVQNFKRRENAFQFTLSADSIVKQFFSGRWLELFIQATVLQLLNKFPDVPTLWARNIQLFFEATTDQAAQQWEIDFFLLFHHSPICFEAKSGDTRNLNRYKQLCRQLQIPASRSFVVIPATLPGSPRCEHLSNRYSVTCCSTTSFARKLHDVLSAIYQQALATHSS